MLSTITRKVCRPSIRLHGHGCVNPDWAATQALGRRQMPTALQPASRFERKGFG
jgi:hypothetical protein